MFPPLGPASVRVARLLKNLTVATSWIWDFPTIPWGNGEAQKTLHVVQYRILANFDRFDLQSDLTARGKVEILRDRES